jgi:phosphoribosylamine--glycine ligase
MRFLVFDSEGMATALAWRLRLEGNEVQFLSLKPEGKEHLLGMVELAPDIMSGVSWVGKDGYIICGDEMSVAALRSMGYKCYGNNPFMQKIETDRNFQHQVAKDAGIKVPNAHHVKNVDEAIKFIQENPDQWVLKQMGHAPKTWNFCGKEDDGSDVIRQLEWMKDAEEYAKLKGDCPFMLQEAVQGLEFATSGWWMGNDWKRRDDGSILVEVNREHKKQLNDDAGLTTGEMGTVMRFPDNLKLFQQTLEKLTPILKKEAKDVVINIDANCGIIEETGDPYLFEFTPREGYPAQSLIIHLLETETGKFFADLIDGKQGGVETKDAWGVVTVLGAGQYPQETTSDNHEGSFKDQPVEIPQHEKLFDGHLHPLYIRWDEEEKLFRVADYYEYVIASTHCEDDIEDANEQCVDDMREIVVRAPQYRTDIGEKFQNEELPKLEDLGFI